jgi:nicotinamidase-related amidase
MGPEHVALVFVDLQEGPHRTVRSMPAADLRANAVALARVARTLSVPTLFAAAAIEGPGGALASEVRAELPDALVVRHATNDVWRPRTSSRRSTGSRALTS